VNGTLVHFSWKVSYRFGNAEMPEAKILTMGLLSDLQLKYGQCTLQLREGDLNEAFIEELNALIQKYPGKCKLRVSLNGYEEEAQLMLVSETLTVDAANPEFQEGMERLIGQKQFLLN
jgi:hypothetical protein